jgi:GTP pyrophosphokinase
MRKLLPAYESANKDELYSKIGTGIIQLENLQEILKKNTLSKWVNYWSLQLGKTTEKVKKSTETDEASQKPGYKTPLLLTESIDKTPTDYILAKCCNPIPGDNVVGFIREKPGERAVIHQSKCPEAIKLLSSHSELFVPVKWTTHRLLSFLVKIKIGGIDRFGIFHDITTVITEELNVNIRGINLTSHDGIWESTMELYVHDTKDVNNLIMGLSRIKGVENVERTELVQ